MLISFSGIASGNLVHMSIVVRNFSCLRFLSDCLCQFVVDQSLVYVEIDPTFDLVWC